jgi:hypothetical protein
MRRPFLTSIVLAIGLAASMLPLHSQDKDQEKNFYGDFLFGYRMVDTSGAKERYREDLNLAKGVRLFNFNLTYLASESLKGLFDRMDLAVYNFGGDPFETLSLSVLKYGTYKFRYERKKSEYFYSDLYRIDPSTLYDLHRFNFERVSDSGFFDLTLAKNLDIFLNFDRYTKSGDSTTTLDISQVQFELSKPISEKLMEVAGGLDIHDPRLSLVFEERYQEYKNTNSLFLPEPAAGEPGSPYPTSLSSFRLDQPYDFKTNIHSFRFNARPLNSLLLRGTARLSKQETHLGQNYQEEATGVNDLNQSFSDVTSGTGSFTREIQLYDADLTYLLFTRLAVVGAVRYNRFTQKGTLTFGGDEEASDFGFQTLGLEGGLELQLFSQLGLTVGYRNEERKLTNLETATFADKTVRRGLFGTLKFELKKIKLTADYQHGDYDDPFTLISPTKFDRYRATVRFDLKGFNASASYLAARTKNVIQGGVNFRIVYADDDYSDVWSSSNDQINVRLGYRSAKFDVYAGYSYIDVKQDSDRLVAYNPYWIGPAGEFPWAIHYEGKSNLIDGSFSWSPADSLKFGVYVNRYVNTGFWPLERNMARANLEYDFSGGFIGQIAYHYVEFKEKDSGYNNYRANIVELSFGYRWD